MLCRYDPGTGRTSPHIRPEILLLSTGNPRKYIKRERPQKTEDEETDKTVQMSLFDFM